MKLPLRFRFLALQNELQGFDGAKDQELYVQAFKHFSVDVLLFNPTRFEWIINCESLNFHSVLSTFTKLNIAYGAARTPSNLIYEFMRCY